jgi:hypothetical protein
VLVNDAALAVQDAEAFARAEDFLIKSLDGDSAGQKLAIACDQGVGLVAREEIVVGATKQLVTWDAEQIFARLIQQDVTKIGSILGEDHVGNCLDDGLEQLQIETARKRGARSASLATRVSQHGLRDFWFDESSGVTATFMVAERDIVDAFGAKKRRFLWD